jgi:hypothetical protein
LSFEMPKKSTAAAPAAGAPAKAPKPAEAPAVPAPEKPAKAAQAPQKPAQASSKAAKPKAVGQTAAAPAAPVAAASLPVVGTVASSSRPEAPAPAGAPAAGNKRAVRDGESAASEMVRPPGPRARSRLLQDSTKRPRPASAPADEPVSSDMVFQPSSHAFGADRVPYINKQRVLVLSSRGVSALYRHLMEDLKSLLPHHKTDVKVGRARRATAQIDTRDEIRAINEIAEMKGCETTLFFEVRPWRRRRRSAARSATCTSGSPRRPTARPSSSTWSTVRWAVARAASAHDGRVAPHRQLPQGLAAAAAL